MPSSFPGLLGMANRAGGEGIVEAAVAKAQGGSTEVCGELRPPKKVEGSAADEGFFARKTESRGKALWFVSVREPLSLSKNGLDAVRHTRDASTSRLLSSLRALSAAIPNLQFRASYSAKSPTLRNGN